MLWPEPSALRYDFEVFFSNALYSSCCTLGATSRNSKNVKQMNGFTLPFYSFVRVDLIGNSENVFVVTQNGLL